LASKGDISIQGTQGTDIDVFVQKVKETGGGYEKKENEVRFFWRNKLQATEITTHVHPGFMTDWQAPWAVLMTQAQGTSHIHETVFENRFGYVKYLQRMGASMKYYDPQIEDHNTLYNFNLNDDKPFFNRAIEIKGPTKLHNAVVKMSDLRAGATLVLAALIAEGTSVIFGVDQLDRGYEKFEERLQSLGAKIHRLKDKNMV